MNFFIDRKSPISKIIIPRFGTELPPDVLPSSILICTGGGHCKFDTARLYVNTGAVVPYWIPYAGCLAKIEVRIPNISVIPEAGVIQHNQAVHLPVVILVLSVLLRCVIRMP